MKKQIQFLPGSYASIIIYYVALAVEFPWHSLNLLPGDHIQVTRCIRKLKDESYIIVHEKGAIRSIKLTKKALPILDKVCDGLYDYYMFNSENHTFRGTLHGDKATLIQNLSRKHRLGEIYCMCRMIDCRLLFNEKQRLVIDKRVEIDESLDTPIFYNSRELKKIDEEQMHKTEFSRLMGLIVSRGGYYNVYSVNNGRFKWHQYGEGKAKVLTEDVINANFSAQFPAAYGARADNAIMFASSFDAAAVILNNEYNVKDSRGFEFLSFDNTYPNVYLLPVDVYGALQLKMITSEDYHNRMMKCIFNEPMDPILNIDCDKYKDGKYILCMFDGNIGRLKRFVMSLYNIGANNAKVICFPWQTDTIRTIVGVGVSIETVDINSFAKDFFAISERGSI